MKTLRVCVLFVCGLILMSMANAGWQAQEQVTDNNVMDQFPWVAIGSNGAPVVVTNEIVPNKKFDIFQYENVNGKWFPANLTNTLLSSDYQPVIKIDSKGNQHVFFLSRIEQKNNKLYVFYMMRDNGTWSVPTSITLGKPYKSPESRPAVTIDSKDNLYVVLHDDDGKLSYLKKTNGQWSPIQTIPTASDAINWYPSLAIDGKDQVHLTYLGGEAPYYSIKYMTLDPAGWSKPETLVTPDWQPWHPFMDVSKKGIVNVVFSCDTVFTRNIGFVSGKAGHWNTPQRLMNDNVEYDYPSLTVDINGNAHLVYHGGVGGNDGNYKVYYTNNISGKFAAPVALTNDNIYHYNPVIIQDKNGIGYVVNYGFDGYDTEIFLQRTSEALKDMKDIKVVNPYSTFTAHQKRYLPPIDLNYIPSESTCLKGKTITISAGHGGLAHWAEYRYGATNTREDEINYGVALGLAEYLQNAGVKVYMCRTTDFDMGIMERPAYSLQNNSDFFISVHHNSFDFYSNYASVYFHGDPDNDPMSADIARMVSQNIADFMNIPSIGAMSDFFSYPGSGYGELRGLKGRPGILGEGSHFYCFDEEEQLRNVNYLKRESYAFFRAVVSYYSMKHPSARLLEPLSVTTAQKPLIKIQLEDGDGNAQVKIIPSSVQLKVDGQKVLADFSWKTGVLTYQSDKEWTAGEHVLNVQFTNFDKLSADRISFKITVNP